MTCVLYFSDNCDIIQTSMKKRKGANMQDKERLSREEIRALYQEDAKRLLQFENWLKKATGTETSDIYSGEGIEETSMSVPVYDSTLLSFIKTAKTTQFMNRNYVYTFSQHSLRTAKDELNIIESCSLQEIKVLGDILSKYCYKGDVKGACWSEGVKNGVYIALLEKLKKLLEIRGPLG